MLSLVRQWYFTVLLIVLRGELPLVLRYGLSDRAGPLDKRWRAVERHQDRFLKRAHIYG